MKKDKNETPLSRLARLMDEDRSRMMCYAYYRLRLEMLFVPCPLQSLYHPFEAEPEGAYCFHRRLYGCSGCRCRRIPERKIQTHRQAHGHAARGTGGGNQAAGLWQQQLCRYCRHSVNPSANHKIEISLWPYEIETSHKRREQKTDLEPL